MTGALFLIGAYLLVIIAGTFVYTGIGFHKRRKPDSTWHDLAIDIIVLGLVVVFIISGIGTYALKGSPDRHGDDWGAVFGLLPFMMCWPLALLTPIIAIFGWNGMDGIHKVRAFIPSLMYMLAFLGSGLTNR